MADVDFTVFKVLVLGDSSVGKSSLIKRFHSNVFDQRLPTTIGVDFFIHDLEVDGKNVKVLSHIFFFGVPINLQACVLQQTFLIFNS